MKKDVDGIYYWTLNGEWLLDENGNKIKAQGVDGKDGVNGTDGTDGTDGENGTNGQDGTDGITPQLKIENDYWYISYDNGKTWEKLGKATGEDGVDGTNGEDGDLMFTSIDTTSSDEYVIFTLSDGTQIKVPTWSAFEALRTQCNQMNTNIESLQALLNVLQSHDYIKSVTPLMENGMQVGYTITFAYANAITIYSNATSPTAPIIGVKKDTDGIYYWTLNGEWLLNDAGDKIKAEGEDGADGSNGTNGSNGIDGKDGITPKLKIEDDYWYVSYDNGTSWTKLGKATGADGSNGLDGVNGENGDNIFSSVTQDDEYVYFNLADGTIITLAKQDKENIQFEDLHVKSICCYSGGDKNDDGELSYTEAAAITSLERVFRGKANVVAFNELKYFTGITYIANYAFAECTSLWKITIPFSVTEIQTCAFEDCVNLSNITIPESVISIGSYAFKNCNRLQSITIPESVTLIASWAFDGCDRLQSIYCKAIQPPTLENDWVFESSIITTIYVPVESVDIYKASARWQKFADKIKGYEF